MPREDRPYKKEAKLIIGVIFDPVLAVFFTQYFA